MWDYEAKLALAEWSAAERARLLVARLHSPPAKAVRTLLFAACHGLCNHWSGGIKKGRLSAFETEVGLTRDVPFSPMEEKALVRLAAACSDDREVDESWWLCRTRRPNRRRRGKC